ncbi:hypothetical protein [Photorhabdus bodei]|uniref:Uncharacterized protein n=1 Tax=Photorhabdus bodei TaxID=2029681 RepID=A0AAW6BK97_9GAMM|nr:hypothetical protein [Photorhabdus bodei]MDB6373847.1 hypothetical protein [Photorhabdus bodei]
MTQVGHDGHGEDKRDLITGEDPDATCSGLAVNSVQARLRF